MELGTISMNAMESRRRATAQRTIVRDADYKTLGGRFPDQAERDRVRAKLRASRLA